MHSLTTLFKHSASHQWSFIHPPIHPVVCPSIIHPSNHPSTQSPSIRPPLHVSIQNCHPNTCAHHTIQTHACYTPRFASKFLWCWTDHVLQAQASVRLVSTTMNPKRSKYVPVEGAFVHSHSCLSRRACSERLYSTQEVLDQDNLMKQHH